MYEKTFYNQSKNKLWKHRVNTSEEANSYVNVFPGIELDVYYNLYRDKFYISHDKDYDIDETETLNQYLTSINEPTVYYYWIDFKNLYVTNINSSIKRLKEVLNNHNIFDHAIVESTYANRLKKFNDEGFFTSYWVPAHDYDGTLSDDNKKDIVEIEQNLSECHHNALSTHAANIPFFTEYFSNYNLHVWTNGWMDERGKELINRYRNFPNVKVILIDYEAPF